MWRMMAQVRQGGGLLHMRARLQAGQRPALPPRRHPLLRLALVRPRLQCTLRLPEVCSTPLAVL